MKDTSTETQSGTHGIRSALGHLPSQLRFWIPAAGLLWLDLWTKNWAFGQLPAKGARPWISGVIEFRRSLNDGAVFGSFTGYIGVFILASVFALAFVIYLFARSRCHQWGLHLALAMILSGAVGNLYDRAFVVADVVRISRSDGSTHPFIGIVLDESSDDTLVVGQWPDGKDPERFKREEVTLRRQGVVRDFIKFIPRFPEWVPRLGRHDVWPWIFNVADASLVCGVILLLFHSRIEGKPRNRALGKSGGARGDPSP